MQSSSPEAPFLDQPYQANIQTDPGQTGRLMTGGWKEVLAGQKEALKPSNLEANFFGESVLLTMRLGLDGQMEVIGSDQATLDRIRQADPDKKDIYISVRIPPSKYSNRSLTIVMGRLDGTCPVMWDEDNAALFAPVWEMKAKLEMELLEAAQKHCPDAKVAFITSQTAGHTWDENKPSTTSVRLNISQLVIYSQEELTPRQNKTSFDHGFEVEGQLIEEFGPDYHQMVEVLNQAAIPPHGVLEYLLRQARPRGWQTTQTPGAQLLSTSRIDHVKAYINQITPWVSNPAIEPVYAQARIDEADNFEKYRTPAMKKSPVDFLMPPTQPSYGEVLILGENGQLYRLIIPVPGYAMGNLERLGLDLNRDDDYQLTIDPDVINKFYNVVQSDLAEKYSIKPQ